MMRFTDHYMIESLDILQDWTAGSLHDGITGTSIRQDHEDLYMMGSQGLYMMGSQDLWKRKKTESEG